MHRVEVLLGLLDLPVTADEQISESSADITNHVLEAIEISYVGEDTTRTDPLMIPPDDQTGPLEGVAALHVTRALQQQIHHTFEPIIELDPGAIAVTA